MARLIDLHETKRARIDADRRVIDVLLSGLNDHYTIMPQTGNKRWQCDVIVVAPHAVYVIDIEDESGEIVASYHEWQVDGRHRAARTRMIGAKAKVLKSKLVAYAPSLDAVWVAGAVVLAREPASLKLSRDLLEPVLELGQLAEFLTDPNKVAQRPFAIRSFERIVLKALRTPS